MVENDPNLQKTAILGDETCLHYLDNFTKSETSI